MIKFQLLLKHATIIIICPYVSKSQAKTYHRKVKPDKYNLSVACSNAYILLYLQLHRDRGRF